MSRLQFRLQPLGAACLLSLTVLIAGCVPRPAATAPPPPPPAQPEPPPPPAPLPEIDWQDAPLSPGDWTYEDAGAVSTARFGTAGAAAFAVRCDAPGRISLIRSSVAAGSMIVIRTSSGERRLAASERDGALVAAVAAGDTLLDEIVFSRGRFLVQAAGAPALIVPAWPEPARVVEDCRA